MSSTIEGHLFCCKPLQPSRPWQIPTAQPLPSDGRQLMTIIFSLFEQTVVCNKDTGDVNTYSYSEPNLKTERRSFIFLPRQRYRRMNECILTQYLSTMGIPQKDRDRFLKSIFEVVRIAIPNLPLNITIVDVTVTSLGCIEDDHGYISRTRSEIRKCIEASVSFCFANRNNTNKDTPAPTSTIENLEKLRVNDLEEATLRHTPLCAICLEDFRKDSEEQITCLPCKHYYHLACIVKCLKIRHTCPMCRYPMRVTAEVSGKTQQIFVCRYIQ